MIFKDFQGPWITPSILSADFLNLKHEIQSLERSGADALHLDIMDGHFVPNISFGPAFVKAVVQGTKLPTIAHLMISNPLEYAKIFADIGVPAISFHIETTDEPIIMLENFKKLGITAGVAIKPSTPINDYHSLAENADFILVMSVEPGFSGQSFKKIALERIEKFQKIRKENNLAFKIEVDGGVNSKNVQQCRDAGADILVSASYILSNPDRKDAIKILRGR